ncbi:hypothetical protein DCAR_0102911 [Daucus carota subsp. sativus]|uniref:Uncharacterized protein n=1 Tax=Daucus carota subsp. sativus TaxID=79200 RepID=A0AAF0W8P5_DAUCS|nr:hypothetical protein DCAR_0102911 [Daucus carota subsp. sativus]
MERDEERWKKFKEEQRKRLRDIEEQSVPKMTDLEILAGKRRIKLQAGNGQSVFKSYSHLVGDYSPLTSVPVMSETLEKTASEISKKLDQHTQKPRARSKAQKEERDERNKKRREKYKAQKEAWKKDGLTLDFESREKQDQLNQKRRARYKAHKEATLRKIELEAKEKHDQLNQKRLEVKNKKRRSRYQNGDAEKREERKNKRQQVYRNENEEQNMKWDASKVIVRTPEKFAGSLCNLNI